MKVLYFIEGNGGGAVTHVLNLAKALPKDTVDPLVVFFLDGPSVQVAQDMGLDTRMLLWRFPLDFTLAWRLRNLMLKEEIDILHTHTITGNFYARMADLFCHRPFYHITTIHSCLRDEIKGFLSTRVKDYLRFRRELLTFRQVHQFIAVSEKIKERMVKFGLPEAKIQVVENGVELPDMSVKDIHNRSVRNEFQIKNNEIVVGTVGRMVPVKNQHILLRAAQRILKRTSHVKFLFVGDGNLLDSLKKEAKERCLEENTIFTGWRNDIDRFFCSFDIFVLCSTVESLNISVMDAMAHTLPVVGSDVRGISDVVCDGETGLLFPLNNVDLLTEKILQLIRNREMAEAMGQKGRERVGKKYSLNRMVTQIVDIYDRRGMNSRNRG